VYWHTGASLCRTITCAGGGGFSGNGVWPSLYDVVVSLLRLQNSKMLWMGIWVHPYAVIRVQVGLSFRGNGVWPSLYDVVVSL